MDIISRKSAKSVGRKYYFTGKPCKRGHIDLRHVSSERCKSCGREKALEYSRRLGVKERTPPQADYQQQYYARNKEKRKAESQAWYQANAERVLGRVKVYASEHREQTRRLGRKSRAKRRAIEKAVFVEVVDPLTVFARDEGICGICVTPVQFDSSWEVDHIVPISKGGKHAYANVQLAHRKCNRAKGAKLLTAA